MIKENLLGRKFGRWTVIGSTESYINKEGKLQGVQWLCKCSCGNSSTVSANSLKKGSSQSCGCLRSEKIKERRRKGFGESASNYVYNLYKQGAKRRGYSFSISLDLFKELCNLPCAYCGCLPATKMETGRGRVFYGSFVYNGLDRVDNAVGYDVNNVVPCCTSCNILKHKIPKKDFLSKIKKIYENLKLNEGVEV